MIQEVTFYKVVCDHDDCEASPTDGSDYAAWAQVEGAMADLEEAWDWFNEAGKHLCPDHAPRRCDSCDGFDSVIYSEEHGGNLCPRCLAVENAAGKAC